MISLSNVSHSFEGKGLDVLDNISLEIKDNEIVTIIGPSGCGKSTLLKIIGGLIAPTIGKIECTSKKDSVADSSDEVLAKGYVFQSPLLFPWLTLKQNVLLPLDIIGRSLSKGADVSKTLDILKLSGFEDYYPDELSGGMQQRASIARALSFNPKILLMDEPFGALDEIARNDLNQELLDLKEKLGLTIVFITHSIIEAVYLGDKVIVLSQRPAKINGMIQISLPKDRTQDIKETAEFQGYVRCIRQKII